jgi:hypothetical protein
MISLNERKQGVQSVSLQCDLHRKRRFAERNFSYGLFARLSDQTGDNQIIGLDDQAGADIALRWCCVAMPSTATSMRKPVISCGICRLGTSVLMRLWLAPRPDGPRSRRASQASPVRLRRLVSVRTKDRSYSRWRDSAAALRVPSVCLFIRRTNEKSRNPQASAALAFSRHKDFPHS